ncbi:MAG: RHS repeat-associated core domain-containing protein [Myxococcota bacterium]
MSALVFPPACGTGADTDREAPGPDPRSPSLSAAPGYPGTTPDAFDPDGYIEPSENVGSLPGGVGVAPNGAAVYSVPLDAPRAFGGNTPRLALSYDSRGLSGTAGKGWSLAGIGAISRCPSASAGLPWVERPETQPLPTVGVRHPAGVGALAKNLESQSVAEIASEQYSNLCLNGDLLYVVPADDSDPEPNAILSFRVAGRPDVRVFALSSAGDAGASSFREYSETGEVRDYAVGGGARRAATSAGVIYHSWPLSKEQDRFGNAVDYTYDSDGPAGEGHRLIEVSYTGGRVELVWDQGEKREGYSHGMRNSSDVILREVRMYGGAGGLVRTYRLGHETSAVSNSDLLDSLEVCDRAGVCLPATKFDYGEGDVISLTLEDLSPFGGDFSLSLSDSELRTAAFSDVDGDSLADLVYLTDEPVLAIASSALVVRHGNGSGGFLPPREYAVELPDGVLASGSSEASVTFGDVTGDGVADPILVQTFRETVFGSVTWGGVFAEALDVTDRTSPITRKRVWQLGGAEPWGCPWTFGCTGSGASAFDSADLLASEAWSNGSAHPNGYYEDSLSDFDAIAPNGDSECMPDPSDVCRAVATMGFTLMDTTGDGTENFVPCVGFLDFEESEQNPPLWSQSHLLFDLPGENGAVHIPNGVFGDPELPEEFPLSDSWRTTCGSWDWGLKAFTLLDVTGEGTRDLLSGQPLPPEPFNLGVQAYTTRSVEFGMTGSANTNLPVDLLQRYSRFDTRGVEDAVAWAEEGGTPVESGLSEVYDLLFSGAARGGESGDIRADLNGDGLLDIVRLEPVQGFADQFGEQDAFVDADPRLACKVGTDEYSLPAQVAAYFNRGDGGFEEGPKLGGFTWADSCRRLMSGTAELDVDADGRDEVLISRPDGSLYDQLELGATGELELSGTTIAGPQVPWYRQSRRSFAVDLNGDGRASLITVRPDDLYEGENDFRARGLDHHVDVLARVTDGFGAETYVEYGLASEVFSERQCPTGLQPHTPGWPMVSSIVRPEHVEGGVQLNRVDLHRYEGWCNGSTVDGGAFEQHFETVALEVGSGVVPGVFSGDAIPVSMRTTSRENYLPFGRLFPYRGDVTRSEQLDWHVDSGTFVRTIKDVEYASVPGSYAGSAKAFYEGLGVYPVRPVAVRFPHIEEKYAWWAEGDCSLADGKLSCGSEAPAELISSGWVRRDFTQDGHLTKLAERNGQFCSEWSADAWQELAFTRVPQDHHHRYGLVAYAGVTPADADPEEGAAWCDTTPGDGSPFTVSVSQEYSSAGKLLNALTDEGGDTHTETSYDWDSDGTLVGVTQTGAASGPRTTEIGGYTANGSPGFVRNALGHTMSYFWEPDLDVILGIYDSNSVLNAHWYDGFGRPTGTRTRAGLNGSWAAPAATIRYERVVAFPSDGATPMRVVATDQAGASTMVEYDRWNTARSGETDVAEDLRVFAETRTYWTGDGFRIERTSPAEVDTSPGPVSVVEIDLHGRERSSTPATAALGVGTTSIEYGARHVLEVDPAGEEWRRTYGEAGELISSRDPNGVLTCFYYGAGVRIRDVVVNPEYGVCAGEVPATTTEAKVTHYEYDASGRMTERRLPGAGVETFEYDQGYELEMYATPEESIAFEYDVLGRVLSKTDSDGVILAEFEYDAAEDCPWGNGRLRIARAPAAGPGGVERRFDYDAFGRGMSSSLSVGEYAFRVDHRFDDYGNLSEVRHGGGGPVIRYGVDSIGAPRLVQVNGVDVWEAERYDSSGALAEVLYGNGVVEERSYYAGLLEWSTVVAPGPVAPYPGSSDLSSVIDSVSLQYDELGRMRTREIPHLGVEDRYRHDSVGRLEGLETSIDGALSSDVTWSYSGSGTMLSRTGLGEYQYGDPAAPLGVSKAGDVTYSYDANGRQSTRNDVAFEWNAWDKLESASGAEVDVSFDYDAFGQRVRTRAEQPLSQTRIFSHGLDVSLDADGQTKRQYRIEAPEGVVAVLEQDEEGERLRFIHSGELGSASVVTDESGNVVERLDFDPFGGERSPFGGAPTWTGDAEIDIGFTGHRKQEGFGLIDMGGRFYDPYVGRFASPDPFVTAPASSQGYDPFSYVRNDPLTYTDPSGYVPIPGYSGDWTNEGVVDGVWWFSCDDCGDVGVVGISADSIIERAQGDRSYLLELAEDSELIGPVERENREVRAANDAWSHQASASPGRESSLAEEIAYEIGYDLSPLAQLHDFHEADEAADALIDDPGWGTGLNATLAAGGFVPIVGGPLKVLGRHADEALDLSGKLAKRARKAVNRLPRSNGRWQGLPGDGKWYSTNPEVLKVTKGEPIVFKNGRPDFSPWAVDTLPFEPGVLTGKKSDFGKVYAKMAAERKDLKNAKAAQEWLKQNNLTPHHKTETVIELIPTPLHGNTAHTGAAADLRRLYGGK